MLKRFEVENFRNFKEKFVFDFSRVKNYEFNARCVKKSLVNKAIVYGPNGCGKSNLGLAIFDIISNLTDKFNGHRTYAANYLNASSRSEFAKFKYVFNLNDVDVEYEYSKKDLSTIIGEKLTINGNVVVDFRPGELLHVNLAGAESLNRDLSTNTKISALRYVKNNTVFKKTLETDIFNAFFEFVEGMLYFRSLQENNFIGFSTGSTNLISDIVENGYIMDFQVFLNEAGLDLKLQEIEEGGKKSLGVTYEGGRTLPWLTVVSTGTLSLLLFYFWLRCFDKVKFVFVDEFDAFYHHQLAKFVVNKLLGSEPQMVITTHNTNLMTNDIFRPDCCFLMNGATIDPIYSNTDKELRQAHNLEKMYIAGALNA